MKVLKNKLIFLVLLFICSNIFALHEGDFILTVDECGMILMDNQVKNSTLNPDFGYASSSPGFDCAAGTFPSGSSNAFNILEPLKKWDDANKTFYLLDPNTEETMVISFLSLWRQSSSGIVEGFSLPVASDGSFHKHLNYTLVGADLNDPCDGVYLLEMELYNTSSQVDYSYPFWIVFNNETDANEPSNATTWVEKYYIDLADIDEDNKVNFIDYAQLIANFSSVDCNCHNQWCYSTDLNKNGIVDINDLDKITKDWLLKY